MQSVDVCVATFKRPALLLQALGSIAAQTLEGIELRVVVVDNDDEQSARRTVEGFRKEVPFEVIYDVEPVQNISMARNRALNHVRAQFVALVDDDEIVPCDWLKTLLKAIRTYSADVIFGPVDGIVPPERPKWASDYPYFQRSGRPTGTVVKHGGAGNALFRTEALGCPPERFDPAYGLSGGEDSEFFFRLYLKGRHMVWCDEALVKEHVPANRMTVQWVRQRSYRGGQSTARIFAPTYSPAKRVCWFALKMIQVTGALMITPIVWILSYSAFVYLTVKIMSSFGQLSILLRAPSYQEYAVRRK